MTGTVEDRLGGTVEIVAPAKVATKRLNGSAGPEPQAQDGQDKAAATGTGTARNCRFTLVRFNEVVLAVTAAYLVHGIIPREGIVVIWGPPKCGKTFWALDLVLHIALDWEYRGHRVKQGAVVYVACEGERGLNARVAAFRKHHGLEAKDAPFYLVTSRLNLAADCQTLIEDIKAQLPAEVVPSAIVIDTLNRSIEGSESNDADMGAYIRAADAVREAFKCAVLVIHHCGIDDKRPRGHTSLTGAVDAQIAVRRDGAGLVSAIVEYLKDGPDGAEGAQTLSRLVPVPLGNDEDGVEITSCIIEPDDSEPVAGSRYRTKATGPAKVALDLLRRAIADAGELAPASNHIPQHARVVELNLWRQYAYDGSVTGSDKPETKRKAFDRAVTKLQENGLVGVWGKLAWLKE